jgi:hypothetical protein
MVLRESQAVQVLNTYKNFCKVFQREGTITDKNFNRIRFINACINGQQDKIKEVWGDLFDEVYCLLQKPEIKLRLEKEQIQLIREKRSLKKRKNQEDKIPEKSIEERREIFWRSIAREKQKDEARKKLRDQNVQPIREVPPMYRFDRSSIFEDIMDERRAEGKGYGGSK